MQQYEITYCVGNRYKKKIVKALSHEHAIKKSKIKNIEEITQVDSVIIFGDNKKGEVFNKKLVINNGIASGYLQNLNSGELHLEIVVFSKWKEFPGFWSTWRRRWRG